MYSIIENHKDFLLISKHPGVGFHKDLEPEGLVEVIKKEPDINNLYTLHRLDRMTSGLLLFAKNRVAAQELSRLFQQRLVEKYYIAISDCRPKKKQGLIKGDMEKSRRGAWMLLRTANNPAVTQFFSYTLSPGLRLFVLKPRTGKTHQLRVALKSIGSPVLGDTLYHKKEEGDKVIDRGYLHSYSLRFRFKGSMYEFIERPETGHYFAGEEFNDALKKCGNPWALKWPVIKGT